MKILIIEDEAELAQLMSNFLRRQPNGSNAHHVAIAQNLSEGILALRTLKPEWIILDNNLPDGKGIQALGEIKKSARRARILMMSALTNLREEALRNGADHFLDKPVSFNDIKNILTP